MKLPGEYVAFDEVDGAQRLRVAMILDSDGLDQRQAGGLEQLTHLAEVSIEVIRAIGFDHLDRDELVIRALQIAVVLEQYRYPIAETGAGDPPARGRVLLDRDGRRRDPAPIVSRGIHR